MIIETTYMKFEKRLGEIIGITKQLRTLKVWAKSQHIQNKLLNDFEYETKIKAPTKFIRKKLKLKLLQIIKIENSWKILSRPAYTHLMLSPTTKIVFVMFTQGK